MSRSTPRPYEEIPPPPNLLRDLPPPDLVIFELMVLLRVRSLLYLYLSGDLSSKPSFLRPVGRIYSQIKGIIIFETLIMKMSLDLKGRRQKLAINGHCPFR